MDLPIVERRVLDSSILSTFSRCQRLAFYKYLLNREADAEDDASTSFGSAYHLYREKLEVISRSTENQTNTDIFHQLALAIALKDFKDPPLGHKKEYLDRGRLIKSCELAYNKWLTERNGKAIRVLSSESSFELELPSGKLYGGKMDQNIEWNNRLWVRDFKTSSWKTDWAAKYSLDHQMSGYVWASQKLSGRRVSGVLVEMLYNTAKQGPEIIPVLTTRTEADLNSFVEWAEAKWDEWLRCIELKRWPMHTTACFDFSKKCAFHDACSRGGMDEILSWLGTNSSSKTWDFSKQED